MVALTAYFSRATYASTVFFRSIHSLISDMQINLSAEFRCLQESVCALSERVEVMETQVVTASQTPSSSGSELESPVGRRKRRIPLELQVCVRVCVCKVICL